MKRRSFLGILAGIFPASVVAKLGIPSEEDAVARYDRQLGITWTQQEFSYGREIGVCANLPDGKRSAMLFYKDMGNPENTLKMIEECKSELRGWVIRNTDWPGRMV